MVTETAWKKLTLAERATLRADGVSFHRARGLCARRHNPNPLKVRGGARLVSDVAEEYAFFADPNCSQIANVRAIAPRLGMTEAALERAVLRAKRRGLLEVAA